MELFPDLSLQISPPPITCMNDNMKEYYYYHSHSVWNKTSSLSMNSMASSSSSSLELPVLIHNQKHLKPPTDHIDMGLMMMMMMMPPGQDSYSSSSSSPSSSSPPEYNCLQFSHHDRRRPMAAAAARFPTKRVRAPRMRWTTSLHARFLHALHLLGGHHRATPKSVLELMEVKDLTLAHVKSHLQMYRTVKTSDRSTMVSSSTGGFENNMWMSGETSEDMTKTTMVMFDDSQTIIRSDNPAPLLWNNTSSSSSNNGHGNWVHEKTILMDNNNNNSRRNMISFLDHHQHHHHEKKYCLSSSGKVNCSSKPNLDFTLGTPLH